MASIAQLPLANEDRRVITTETTYRLGEQRIAAALFGPGDCNLRLIREIYDVQLAARSGTVRLAGTPERVRAAEQALQRLEKALSVADLSTDEIRFIVLDGAPPRTVASGELDIDGLPDRLRGKMRARSSGQEAYIRAMMTHDIVFATGPAGTGKTFLAVAMAVAALKGGRVRKIVLVRPAVEAGEKLGYLPGDYHAKINPYLRPLYDALGTLMPPSEVSRLVEKEQIEIVPLAYMRGRTLQDAFIIMDEAQNTTPAQMKMFLTRLGLRSRIVITGDITQIDLAPGQACGLIHARGVLSHIEGIEFVQLSAQDIVRHALVQEIVDAYEDESAAPESPHGGPNRE